MNAVAAPNVLTRWAIQAAHCTARPQIESMEHARYVMSAHAGHGGCPQYLGALAYGSAAL
ncbi:hypothetical protein [Nocardia callitridis]|uniref:Uncharacterized protein n=1 Tax=Nocardia callitridis TaxID=648753 RepID=A0ABP9K1T3_9NOCA